MDTASIFPVHEPDLLLRLLREDVRGRIKAALTEVAESVVQEAADAAVAGLELKIATMLDQYNGRLLVKVMDARGEK